MGAFKVLENKRGKFAFRLVAANGQIILSSDTFDTKAAVEDAIKAVSESATIEDNFERKSTLEGDYYFVLKTSNGRILGRSDAYASQAARETGIWSVKKNSRPAKIVRP